MNNEIEESAKAPAESNVTYADEPPENSEWSRPEKEMIVKLIDPSPRLELGIVVRKNAKGGEESLYEGATVDDLKKCWPFIGNKPRAKDKFVDIHSKTEFEFKDARILRYHHRNVLVAPLYLEEGGTILDFCNPGSVYGGGVLRVVSGKNMGVETIGGL